MLTKIAFGAVIAAVLAAAVSASTFSTKASTVDQLNVAVLTESSTALKVGWTPVSGASGYDFYVNGGKVATSNNPSLDHTTFAKVSGCDYSCYVVESFVKTVVSRGSPKAAACNNKADDDGDGLIDYPADPGCSSKQDNDESNPAGPAAPANVHVLDSTQTSINIGWDAVSGATNYRTYLDGAFYKEGPGSSGGFSDSMNYTGLTCGTSHTLGVEAQNSAGATSPRTSITASTAACSTADTTPPSAPGGLMVSGISQTGFTLAWNASTDNVGVTGYDVYRGTTKVATQTTRTYGFTGLTCNTSYTVGVLAFDAAGNRSAQTTTSATTSACSAPPQCSDSADNDGDGKIDYPADPGCSSATDNDETDPTGQETISAATFESRAVSGATISNVHVTGDVQVTHTNVTVQNSTFDGEIGFEPGASGSKLVGSKALMFYIAGADNILIDGNFFDGQKRTSYNFVWDSPANNVPSNWVIRNNTFQHFWVQSDPSNHSEALFIGYSELGLIENNHFFDNGTTSHIFFSWWGDAASSSNYPHDICVRGNTFQDDPNGVFHYFDVNFRSEIPSNANIKIQLDASNTNPEFYGAC